VVGRAGANWLADLLFLALGSLALIVWFEAGKEATPASVAQETGFLLLAYASRYWMLRLP
jgi:hypothetical protein